MIKHESLCFANPKNNRPCFSCGNLIKKEAVISETYYNGTECIRKVDLLFCKYHNYFVHTPQTEIKGNAFDTDEPNEPMPKQCDEFETPELVF